MTPRKPPNVSVPTWVERQIRDATQSGAFDDLPGAGKPLPHLERSDLRARELVEALNRRILRALAAPQVGPPLRVRPVRVDAALEQWRADRQALDDLAATAAEAQQRPAPDPPTPNRRPRIFRRSHPQRTTRA